MFRARIGNRNLYEAAPVRVTIWNENIQERTEEDVARRYPKGIHGAIADGIRPYGFLIHTATFDEAEHGLTEKVLEETDVLIWWGHVAHERVSDEVVNRVYERVLQGMGLIVLHSGHFSQIFKKLMGTSCNLKWRESGDKAIIWVVNPAHPIAEGLGPFFELPEEEMYGEFFDIPVPDDLIFVSWFKGGEVFRSGCTFYRGLGKIFYFQPGHEDHPTYYNPNVRRVIANAVRWCALPHGAQPVYGYWPPSDGQVP